MKIADDVNSRWKPGLIGAALTGFAGAFLVLTVLGDGLANLSYDLLFRLRPVIRPEGAALVFMDDRAADKLGQPWKSGTWDKSQYARLIDRLVACRAKAIVFDILFDRPGTNDALLIQAAAAARRAGVPIIVGADFDHSLDDEAVLRNSTPLALPFAELREVVDYGLVVGPRSHERVIRRHANIEPSLAMTVARRTLPQSPPRGTEERWINYYGPPLSLPRFRFSLLLETNFAHAGRLSNQVVFVGEMSAPAPNPGGNVRDSWPTPFTGWIHPESSGLEINATAYLNVARGDWLRRLPNSVEALIALGAGALLGFGFTRCRPWHAMVAAAATGLATAAGALWALWQEQVWFPWLIIAAAQTLLALGWSVLSYTRKLSRQKVLLERKVALMEPALEFARMGAYASRLAEAGLTGSLQGGLTLGNSAAHSLAAPTAKDKRGPSLAIPDHTLIRSIGEGAYGEVWLARNAVGLLHAVKLVHRASFKSQEPFEREFRGIQRFMGVSRLHPGLVQILHVGRDDSAGCLYYVMEPGDDETTGPQIDPLTYSPKNLAKEIKRRGRLPGAECVEVGLVLTAALAFLHARQLIHRDIKPSNIIFVRGQPKFTDIGLVTEIATTKTDVSYLGTEGYIAPEGPGHPPADIFSLGRVLYEAWAGLPCERYPELPSGVRQWPDRDLVLALNKIVIKACHPDLAQRYASAALMGEDLQRLSKLII